MSDTLPYDPSQIGQLVGTGDPKPKINYYLRIIKALLPTAEQLALLASIPTQELVADWVDALIAGGAGIDKTYDDAGNLLTLTVNLAEISATLNETVDDRVNALIQAGSGLTKTYDDAGNLLTLGVDFSGATNNEAIDDRVNALIQDGSGIAKTYDDAGNLLTLAIALSELTGESPHFADLTIDGAVDFGSDGSTRTLWHVRAPKTGNTFVADGIRFLYVNSFFGINNDALVFQKTDYNNDTPDGGVCFTNIGNTGIEKKALAIYGSGVVQTFVKLLANRIDIEGEAGGADGFYFTRAAADSTNTAYLRLRTCFGTLASRTATPNGCIVGRLIVDGHDGIAHALAGQLACYTNEDWDADSHGSHWRISAVRDGEIADREVARIFADGIAMGTGTLDPCAILALNSSTRGFLLPRMTTTNVDAMTSPPDGLLVHDSTTKRLKHRSNGAFKSVSYQEDKARTTVVTTSSSLAVDALEQLQIAIGQASHVLCIQTNVPAWIRIYNSEANRDADLGRAIGTPSVAGDGCLVDLVTASGDLTKWLTPAPLAYSAEGYTNLPLTVVNKHSVTSTVVTTVTRLLIEP